MPIKSERLHLLQKATSELYTKLNRRSLSTPDALSSIVRILTGLTLYLEESEQKKYNT